MHTTLTNVVLQTQGKFGPQHDKCKRGVEVHIICVVHSVLLTWKTGNVWSKHKLIYIHTHTHKIAQTVRVT